MIKIRKAQDNDAKAIIQIGRISFTYAFGHLFNRDILGRYLDATYSFKKIHSSLSKPNNIYFIGEIDDVIVGFLKLKRNCPHHLIQDSYQWQVQKIYVFPDCASKGVGSELMKTGERTIAVDMPGIAWLMVYGKNKGAISFYQRFGYIFIGKDYHDFEHIRVGFNVMKKRIQ